MKWVLAGMGLYIGFISAKAIVEGFMDGWRENQKEEHDG